MRRLAVVAGRASLIESFAVSRRFADRIDKLERCSPRYMRYLLNESGDANEDILRHVSTLTDTWIAWQILDDISMDLWCNDIGTPPETMASFDVEIGRFIIGCSVGRNTSSPVYNRAIAEFLAAARAAKRLNRPAARRHFRAGARRLDELDGWTGEADQ